MNWFASMVQKFRGATARRARFTYTQEPTSVMTSITVSTVSSALRLAEQGETRDLFAIYRDMCAGGSHLQSELNKRKMAVVGQPLNLLPYDKEEPEDVRAARRERARKQQRILLIAAVVRHTRLLYRAERLP